MPAPPARHFLPIWFLAPFARVPLPAWAIGLLISLAVTALYVAMELAYQLMGAATDPLWTADHADLVITGALLVGFIPTAVCYGALASERRRRELRPLLRNSDAEIESAFAAQAGFAVRGFWLAGLAGALIWNGLFYYLAGIPLAWHFQLEGWDHYEVFNYGINLVVFTVMVQASYLAFSGARGAGAADRLSWHLDLLDLRPLAPFVREGTTHAVLWIVGISIASLSFLASEADNEREIIFRIGILLFCLIGAAAALILPMRGVHRLISRLKQEELERVRAAIRGDRSALTDSGISARAETLSLADLVAYRDLIASVREWPVRPTTFLRLFLLLVIPIGSWIGGALVERMLGNVLD